MSQIPWLESSNFVFPHINTALDEPDGLLAASECLTPELVIDAYKNGVFPWYSEGQPVLWWSPNPRCVLYPEKFHVSRSFKRSLNSNKFTIKINTRFRETMLACAAPRTEPTQNDEPGTWITSAMLDTYCQLHEMNIAHSIECWHDDKLVGGMYGLALGDIFFGESMFSRMKDASKIAMHHLCTQINPFLIDAQVYSKHLDTLGAEVIERQDFIDILKTHTDQKLNLQGTKPIISL